jgi:hypothetical protein
MITGAFDSDGLYRLARTSESSNWTLCGACEASRIASLIKVVKQEKPIDPSHYFRFGSQNRTLRPWAMQAQRSAHGVYWPRQSAASEEQQQSLPIRFTTNCTLSSSPTPCAIISLALSATRGLPPPLGWQIMCTKREHCTCVRQQPST